MRFYVFKNMYVSAIGLSQSFCNVICRFTLRIGY